MGKIIELLGGYGDVLGAVVFPLVVFLVGLFLPIPKFTKYGKKSAESIPPVLAKLIADRLEAFKRGMLEESHQGDANIISNDQLINGVEKLKIDMGLDE